MDIKELKNLLQSEQGKPIKSFLLSHYLRLKSIDSVKDCDSVEAMAVEVKATKKAIKIIEGILNEIMELEQTFERKGEEDKLFQL